MAIRACTNTTWLKKTTAAAHKARGALRMRAKAHRNVAETASAPKIALIARHPKGLSPNSHSPSAINSLPSGGCSSCIIWPAASHFWAVGTYQVSSKIIPFGVSTSHRNAASDRANTTTSAIATVLRPRRDPVPHRNAHSRRAHLPFKPFAGRAAFSRRFDR